MSESKEAWHARLHETRDQSVILRNAERITRINTALRTTHQAIGALEESKKQLYAMVSTLETELPRKEEAPEGQVYKVDSGVMRLKFDLGEYVIHHSGGGPSVFTGTYHEGEADHLTADGAYYASRLEVVIDGGNNETPLFAIGVDGQTACPIEMFDYITLEPADAVPDDAKRPPRDY